MDLETTGDANFMNYPLGGIFNATGDYARTQPDAPSAELVGSVQGNDFNWDTELMLGLGLHFSGTVDGADRISGTMSSDGLPAFPFSGVRAS